MTLVSLLAIDLSAQVTWAQLSAGGEFTVGLSVSGDVYTWGYNGSGQLGNGSSGNLDVKTPTKIIDTIPMKAVRAGNFHVLALARDSSLWAWGYNAYGQVLPDSIADIISTPVQVDTSHKWVKIYAGFDISFAVDTLGDIYVWGSNLYGAAGVNSTENTIRELTKLDKGKDFKQLSCGKDFVLALDYDGSVWGWGDNSMHTLTVKHDSIERAPVLIDSTERYMKVAASFNSAHALTVGGDIFSWGSNKYLESGIKDAPEILDTLRSMDEARTQDLFYTDITCGGIQCFASTDKLLYTWGTNNIWNFINGKSESDTAVLISSVLPGDYTMPIASKGLDDGLNIFGGHILFFRKTSDRTTYCGVGPNYVGQIGTGKDKTKIESITCGYGQVTTQSTYADAGIDILTYPNPAHNELFIDAHGLQMEHIFFINLRGELVRSKEVSSTYLRVPLQNVPRGLYIMHVRMKNGDNFNTKIIVQ